MKIQPITEAKQLTIARFCGRDNFWVLMKRGLYYRPNGNGYTSDIESAWILSEEEAEKHIYPHDDPVTKHRALIPDYPNSLDACAEFERRLTQDQCEEYETLLEQSVDFDTANGCPAQVHTFHATATQRCRAFLTVIDQEK